MRRPLLVLATLLAFCVVGLGAYVRLSDAGLGCPDWPGCYGHLIGVPDQAHEQAQAEQAFPGKPVHTGKAWKEMIHRYLAGTLGLLVLALTVLAWRHHVATATTTLLAGVIVFQALLGMWTVTLLLKPLVVTAHLLGGMTTLALLVWLAQKPDGIRRRGPRSLALAALLVVVVQIALGGWVSSNYAALACPDFPTCRGAWLPIDGPTAIHLSHRLWAVVVALVAGGLAASLIAAPVWRHYGLALASLLLLQVGLGIANVLLSLPLPIAVAHNLGAALLLAALVVVNYRLRA
jgi:heme a synthase